MMSKMVPSEITAILKQHKSLVLDKERQKVKCCLTNHEMPLTVEAIGCYINGKKYKKVSQMAAFDLGEHKTHIIPSNKRKHLHEMFCTLTLRHLEKTPQAIQRHITGRKYTNALARWKKCQETGERFVPHVRRKGKLPRSFKADKGMGGNKDNPFDDDSDNDFHGNQDSDNMSDLYPDEDDEETEDESEEENEDPAPSSNGKKEKVQKVKQSIKAGKKQSDESDSDYELSALDSSSMSSKPAKSDMTSSKKRDSEGLPVTNSVKPKMKKKRKFEEGSNQSEKVKKEKKKKKKKKEIE